VPLFSASRLFPARPIHTASALLLGMVCLSPWVSSWAAGPTEPTTTPKLWSDGPYLQFSGANRLTARWVCDNQAITEQLPAKAMLAPRCGYTASLQLADQDQQLQQDAAVANWQFKAKRIAAISDIHGQYSLMLRLLQAAKVLDNAGQWRFGNGHLVIVGDVMDRGDAVTSALWHLYSLQQQAAAAGGALHLVPGNHETMVLRGDLRYLNEKYVQVSQILGQSQQQLYGADTVLGQWLRRQPLFVRINDSLFVHGGISPTFARLTESPTEILAQYRQSIGKSRDELKAQPLQALLQGSDGPLWYRGFFRTDSDFSAPTLQQLLARYGAKRVIVGHTTMDQVYQHHQGLVWSTDSDIKDGEQGEVLHFADDQWFKTGLDGQAKPVTDGSQQHKTKSISY